MSKFSELDIKIQEKTGNFFKDFAISQAINALDNLKNARTVLHSLESPRDDWQRKLWIASVDFWTESVHYWIDVANEIQAKPMQLSNSLDWSVKTPSVDEALEKRNEKD